MNKILLIVSREYFTKIKKKAFWIMAFLGPIFFALTMIVPLWLGMQKEEKKIIQVDDRSGLIQNKLLSSPSLNFIPVNQSTSQNTDVFGLLIIPETILEDSSNVIFYSKARIPSEVKFYIERTLTEVLSQYRLKSSGIDPQLIHKINAPVKLKNEKLNIGWEKDEQSAALLFIALFSSILILFFIMLYGQQVMRGVMEEKMNRIVEVIISSVRPFELMMGKIIGIALISLTQFLIWICLSYSISSVIQWRYGKVFDAFSDQKIEQTLANNPNIDAVQAFEINKLVGALDAIDFGYQLSLFLTYFIFGYLLYASLFAGIGSAVDTETDTQQFVFPLIMPLITVMLLATGIIANPHSDVAFWLSIIPFTSPVAMMLRLPFDVPLYQIILSISILILSFIFFTWISARIYRVGILMYGKKVNFAELKKWIFIK
jgi:ABC-2 type transport system permease protein